tara:strand:- start:792 stop:1244 length:453 start_codon:yes stop_codon:yes gene_type:complete
MRVIAFIIYFFSFLANCHEYKKNNVIIDHPILKVSSNTSNIGAGYLKIINNSDKDIYLKAISSDVSEKLEVHEIIKENDIYKMRPIKKDLLIISGKELLLKAKSYHAMFYNFKRALKNNDMIEAKIHFKNSLEIPIKFKVIVGGSSHNHH